MIGKISSAKYMCSQGVTDEFRLIFYLSGTKLEGSQRQDRLTGHGLCLSTADYPFFPTEKGFRF